MLFKQKKSFHYFHYWSPLSYKTFNCRRIWNQT